MKIKSKVLLCLLLFFCGCYRPKPKNSSCSQELTYKTDITKAGEDAIYQGASYFMDLYYGSGDEQVLAKVDTASSALVLSEESAPGKRGGKPFIYSFGSNLAKAKNAKSTIDMVCASDLDINFAIAANTISIPNTLGLSYGDTDRLNHEKKVTPFFDQMVEQYGYKDIFSLSLCGFTGKSNIVLGGFDEKVPLKTLVPLLEKSSFVLPATKIIRSDSKKVLANFPTYNPDTKEGIKTILDSSSAFIQLPVEMISAVVGEIIAKAEKLGLLSAFPQNYFSTQRGSGTKIVRFNDQKQIKQFPYFEIEFLDGNGEKQYLLLSPEYYFKAVDEKDNLVRIFGFRHTQGTIVLGQPFIENHYMIFDREQGLVGFGDINKACRR